MVSAVAVLPLRAYFYERQHVPDVPKSGTLASKKVQNAPDVQDSRTLGTVQRLTRPHKSLQGLQEFGYLELKFDSKTSSFSKFWQTLPKLGDGIV